MLTHAADLRPGRGPLRRPARGRLRVAAGEPAVIGRSRTRTRRTPPGTHDAARASPEAAAPAPVRAACREPPGLLTASAVYGLALGGLFAACGSSQFAYGRVARGADRKVTAYRLAAAAFVVVYLEFRS
jgi:hypothetical protein